MNRKLIAIILSVILVSGVGVATVINNNKNPTTSEANEEVEKNIKILEENEADIINSKSGNILEIEKNHNFEKKDIDNTKEDLNTDNKNPLERVAEEDTERKLDEIKSIDNQNEDPISSINNSQIPSNSENPNKEKSSTENSADKIKENISVPYQSRGFLKEEEGIYLSEVENIIYNKVNEQRTRVGIEKIKDSSTMKYYARKKSEDMATEKYFSHEGISGELTSDLMKADDVKFTSWGENIGFLSTDSEDPLILAEKFINHWMNSKEHKENILSKNFSGLGVGVYRIGDSIYATQEFYK